MPSISVSSTLARSSSFRGPGSVDATRPDEVLVSDQGSTVVGGVSFGTIADRSGVYTIRFKVRATTDVHVTRVSIMDIVPTSDGEPGASMRQSFLFSQNGAAIGQIPADTMGSATMSSELVGAYIHYEIISTLPVPSSGQHEIRFYPSWAESAASPIENTVQQLASTGGVYIVDLNWASGVASGGGGGGVDGVEIDDGSANGQLVLWDHVDGEYQPSGAPASDGQVPRYDETGRTMVWETPLEVSLSGSPYVNMRILVADGTQYTDMTAPGSGDLYLKSNAGNTALEWGAGGGGGGGTALDNGTASGQLAWWNQEGTDWVTMTDTPTTGEYLKWNGSAFIFDTPAGGGGGGTTLSDGTVTGQIAFWNQESTAWVTSTDTIATGEYLQWNGTTFVGTTPAGGGGGLDIGALTLGTEGELGDGNTNDFFVLESGESATNKKYLFGTIRLALLKDSYPQSKGSATGSVSYYSSPQALIVNHTYAGQIALTLASLPASTACKMTYYNNSSVDIYVNLSGVTWSQHAPFVRQNSAVTFWLLTWDGQTTGIFDQQTVMFDTIADRPAFGDAPAGMMALVTNDETASNDGLYYTKGAKGSVGSAWATV